MQIFFYFLEILCLFMERIIKVFVCLQSMRILMIIESLSAWNNTILPDLSDEKIPFNYASPINNL